MKNEMEGRKTPYTTKELFNIINQHLKEKGLLPDILDYGIAESKDIPIRSYAWDLIGIVNFGGSEGIYLDLYCYGNTGNSFNEKKIPVGTYKTLETSKDAYKIMGNLNAEFVYETLDFVNNNMDDFTWDGYDVTVFDDEKQLVKYTTSITERAMELVKDGLKKGNRVTIRNNATRNTKTYHTGEIPMD